jgi:hypothetical protein
MDKFLININKKHNWSYWKTRTTGKMCKSILQIQGKVPEQPSKSPVTETPQQFEKIYKRKTTRSTSKMSETKEERSTKRQKTEVLNEDEDQRITRRINTSDQRTCCSCRSVIINKSSEFRKSKWKRIIGYRSIKTD